MVLQLTIKNIYSNIPPYTLIKKGYTWNKDGGDFLFSIKGVNVEGVKSKIVSDILIGCCVDCNDYDRIFFEDVVGGKKIKRIRRFKL